jgi:hypothetical protein
MQVGGAQLETVRALVCQGMPHAALDVSSWPVRSVAESMPVMSGAIEGTCPHQCTGAHDSCVGDTVTCNLGVCRLKLLLSVKLNDAW